MDDRGRRDNWDRGGKDNYDYHAGREATSPDLQREEVHIHYHIMNVGPAAPALSDRVYPGYPPPELFALQGNAPQHGYDYPAANQPQWPLAAAAPQRPTPLMDVVWPQPARKVVEQPKDRVRRYPEVSTDEAIKVFKLLLSQFEGRAKLGYVLFKRGDLLKGFTYEEASEWFRLSDRFLTFEKNGQVKFVSVFCKNSQLCFNYRKRNTDRCYKENCSFFHVCRNFVLGACRREEQCPLGHSFHKGSNAKVCSSAGLLAFTDNEIRVIVRCSNLVVCSKFNTNPAGTCSEDCPDLHLCCRYVRNDCNKDKDSCPLGHSLKDSDHNKWVLDAFRKYHVPESMLLKIVLAAKCWTGSDSATPVGSLSPKAATSGATIKGCPLASAANQVSDDGHAVPDVTVGAAPLAKPTPAARRLRTALQDKGLIFPVQTAGDGQCPPSKALAAHHGDIGQQPQQPTASNDDQQKCSTTAYSHLCPRHTWTGACPKGDRCPMYHHRDRPPYVWQLFIDEQWRDLSRLDSVDMEKSYCKPLAWQNLQVVVDTIGGLELLLDYEALKATAMTDLSKRGISVGQVFSMRRWSTPSYIRAKTNPFNFYTQRCWYYQDDSGKYVPFRPPCLQYMLELKDAMGQQKYYFEADGALFLVIFRRMLLVPMLTLGRSCSKSIRRLPIFHGMSPTPPLPGSIVKPPEMSELLLREPPPYPSFSLPAHWSRLDVYRNHEIVDLDLDDAETLNVLGLFGLTMPKDRFQVTHVFRIQNPSFWEKYCCMKETLERNALVPSVNERTLFHGVSELQAAMDICANGLGCLKAMEGLYGKGTYFTTLAINSHNISKASRQILFVCKVLVGQYTQGKAGYTKPPVREGLRLYDSCVDDVTSPKTFVIFDTAQSYPEYLIMYKEAGGKSP